MDLGALLHSCRWCDIGNFLVSKTQCCRLNQFEIWVNSHTVPHYAMSDHIRQLNFDLSRSLNVKYDGGFGLPIYKFLLVFNSNIWPNSNAVQDISL